MKSCRVELFHLSFSFCVPKWDNSCEQYFPSVLFIMLYRMVLTFVFVDGILKFIHSNDSYRKVLSFGFLIMLYKYAGFNLDKILNQKVWPEKKNENYHIALSFETPWCFTKMIVHTQWKEGDKRSFHTEKKPIFLDPFSLLQSNTVVLIKMQFPSCRNWRYHNIAQTLKEKLLVFEFICCQMKLWSLKV